MKKKINWFLVTLIFLNLIVFLPTIFEPASYGDECIYLTLGNAFKRGLVFYRDIHDNKPPLLYLFTAAANGNLIFFRFLALLWNSIHLFLIFSLVKMLTKKNSLSLTTGFLFILANLFLEGKVANGEIFMMMPVTLAVYLLVKEPKKRSFRLNSSIGFLFALGFLFKIPVLFDFIGIIIAFYLLPLSHFNLKSILATLKKKDLWIIVGGFLAPILLSLVYYGLKGAFTPYLRSALMQNIGYLSSWQGNNLGLIIRGVILLIITILILRFRKKILILRFRKKIGFAPGLFFLWFIFALFGALLSERPYPHYLLEVIPSLSILTAILLQHIITNFSTFIKNSNLPASPAGRQIPNSKQDLILLVTIYCLLITSYFYFHFWWYPIIKPYKQTLSYLFGKINRQEYLSSWGEKTVNDYQLAQFVKEHSFKNDRLFVWGDGVCVYALSKRLPPGRYTVNYHIYDFNGFDETLGAIENKKPPIIIKLKDETRQWSALDVLLAKHYHQLAYDDFSDQIFLRNR